MKYVESSKNHSNYNFLEFLKFSFVNTFIDKPLHRAAKEGNLDRLRSLVDIATNLNEYDELGYTPLHYAVNNNHLECVRTLLKQGAEPDIQTNNHAKRTALHEAIYNKQKLIVKLLLQYGANYTTLKDSEGNTALTVAKQVDGMYAYFDEATKEKRPSNSLQEQSEENEHQSIKMKLS
jgi:ankyrin repeat protein